MTINYGGDAGGQPRLLIPTIDKIEDPAVEIAMNSILRWANTLLMPAPGTGLSLKYYGGFSVNSRSGGNLTWNVDQQLGGWVYLQPDTFTFEYPNDTISIVVLNVAAASSHGSLEGFLSAEPPCNRPTEAIHIPAGTFAVQGSVIGPDASSDGGFNGGSVTGFHLAGVLGQANSSQVAQIAVHNGLAFSDLTTLEGWLNIVTLG